MSMPAAHTHDCCYTYVLKISLFKASDRATHMHALLLTVLLMIIGRRAIQGLEVRCVHTKNGCKWEGTIGTIKEHQCLYSTGKSTCRSVTK